MTATTERVRMLGVEVDALTLAGLTGLLAETVARGDRVLVANHNLHSVYLYHRSDPMRELYARAAWTLIDGMPLVMGARMLGVPLTGRVTGADLVPALAERAAERGYSIFLLGARPGVAARAAQILKSRHAGLNIVGVLSPPNTSISQLASNPTLNRLRSSLKPEPPAEVPPPPPLWEGMLKAFSLARLRV